MTALRSDARLSSSYLAALDEPGAYATTKVGWGTNSSARIHEVGRIPLEQAAGRVLKTVMELGARLRS